MSAEPKRYRFELKQGGERVASGSAPSLGWALREGARYATIYEPDGPVSLLVKPERPTKTPAPEESVT